MKYEGEFIVAAGGESDSDGGGDGGSAVLYYVVGEGNQVECSQSSYRKKKKINRPCYPLKRQGVLVVYIGYRVAWESAVNLH